MKKGQQDMDSSDDSLANQMESSSDQSEGDEKHEMNQKLRKLLDGFADDEKGSGDSDVEEREQKDSSSDFADHESDSDTEKQQFLLKVHKKKGGHLPSKYINIDPSMKEGKVAVSKDGND